MRSLISACPKTKYSYKIITLPEIFTTKILTEPAKRRGISRFFWVSGFAEQNLRAGAPQKSSGGKNLVSLPSSTKT
ncbi:hypothetical protein, partial [Methylomicrobium sp. Wu6]|uniref:hypothetical protein n=1 Tax=Methylomicrobium sp. Wu6 TaxID=3107928 RepID=UPI002DD636F6